MKKHKKSTSNILDPLKRHIEGVTPKRGSKLVPTLNLNPENLNKK
jgi:hypothetical protein